EVACGWLALDDDNSVEDKILAYRFAVVQRNKAITSFFDNFTALAVESGAESTNFAVTGLFKLCITFILAD
ncbi:unnamed protein product, partial [Effrenium voratum]